MSAAWKVAIASPKTPRPKGVKVRQLGLGADSQEKESGSWVLNTGALIAQKVRQLGLEHRALIARTVKADNWVLAQSLAVKSLGIQMRRSSIEEGLLQ